MSAEARGDTDTHIHTHIPGPVPGARPALTDLPPSPLRAPQYGLATGGAREGGLEAPAHENPEWEKARQALASISKAAAAGGKSGGGGSGGAQVRGDPGREGILGGLRGGAGSRGGGFEGCRRVLGV